MRLHIVHCSLLVHTQPQRSHETRISQRQWSTRHRATLVEGQLEMGSPATPARKATAICARVASVRLLGLLAGTLRSEDGRIRTPGQARPHTQDHAGCGPMRALSRARLADLGVGAASTVRIIVYSRGAAVHVHNYDNLA